MSASGAPPRILVAGVGNVLRGDDGFGPAVVEALDRSGPPPGVRTLDSGIGGMGLIHELLDGFDALVVVDAVDRGDPPGTLTVLEPAVPDAEAISADDRLAMTDVHQLVPGRTMVMARALGILPPFVRILGCQPAEVDELITELSPPVAAAVPEALEIVLRLVDRCLEEGARA